MDDLNEKEVALFARLPKPQTTTHFRTTNVWIVEWLPEREQRTGLQLHQWMQGVHPQWSAYRRCSSKEDVLRAIEEVIAEALRTGMVPFLHLEAHGNGKDHEGLVGPSLTGTLELLSWDELIEPLQRLNVVTRCNLVVFFAACTGIAGLKALTRGPRAPALAVVGSDSPLLPSELLAGAKEFYRRVMDRDPNLQDVVDSASQEVGSVDFEYEPFTGMWYDVMVERLIISMRPEVRNAQQVRLRQRLKAETPLSDEEIENRLRAMPLGFPEESQKMWDEMFMIDLYPENQDRFGLDVRTLVAVVVDAAKQWY